MEYNKEIQGLLREEQRRIWHETKRKKLHHTLSFHIIIVCHDDEFAHDPNLGHRTPEDRIGIINPSHMLSLASESFGRGKFGIPT